MSAADFGPTQTPDAGSGRDARSQTDSIMPALAEALRTLPGYELPREPYPGFRPFRRDEWPIFFGRERQVSALLSLLNTHHFICVHGPSGAGKSSLLEAGLIATLEFEHARLGAAWRSVTFRPGDAPLWN